MRKIELLDCTLRDGGYVNNWHFGSNNIKNIITSLQESNIEYIECGFLTNSIDNYDNNFSLFITPNNIKETVKFCNSKIALMIKVGDFCIENLTPNENTNISIIRLAFHKEDIKKVDNYVKEITSKGYKLFIQPTNIMS